MGRDIQTILARLQAQPQSVRFAELRWLCEQIFGAPRQEGSHLVFRTGLVDQPIVNIQPRGAMAKEYQCRQVFKAVRRKQETS